MKKVIKMKIEKIKLVITDVDGVLTDGGMYYTKQGDIMKRFYARDGMGVTLLRNIGIPTIIITGEQTQMVKQMMEACFISPKEAIYIYIYIYIYVYIHKYISNV